ncbi:GNAT family N-acetyltransferase [bacterium]|nr:MAG: GNAT family N-acetyltransferase [bacterium]
MDPLIRPCATDDDFAAAIAVTKDYVRWLGMDLAFQGLDAEFAAFPVMYGPPEGVFLLAWEGPEPAGGVGLRRLEPGVCEMKRLFVYDRFQGRGLGRGLCVGLIERARALGYGRMRLDTIARMEPALALYATLGFVKIAPYRFNPDPGAVYLELRL